MPGVPEQLELPADERPITCVVVEFRLRADGPWLLCRGAPDASLEQTASVIRRRFPGVVAIRSRELD